MTVWKDLLMGDAPFSGLTYKGHGKTHGDPFDEADARSLNYNTVLGGSSPAEGDLVCWLCGTIQEYYEPSSSFEFYRLAVGNGWVEGHVPDLPTVSGTSQFGIFQIMAKVIEASDLSAPPQWFFSEADATIAAHGFWIAYSVTGAIASLTVPVATRNYGGASAPSNVAVNSSDLDAPATAITMAASFGTDGSIQLSGITLDYEEAQANWGEYFSNTLDSRFGAKKDVGGANYTLSKGDDGNANALFGGYVRVA